MAAQTNGRAKKPKVAGSNGHLNGHVNASKLAGPVAHTRSTRKQKKTLMASFINVVTRLLSYYVIITVFFRCPTSVSRLDDASPQICGPYLHARSYATPYVDPYYQAYVAPQVEKARPYIDRFDAQFYTPVSSFTKNQYAAYGAPQVARVSSFVEAEWNRVIRPRLDSAQAYGKGQYDHHIGPHITKAANLAAPYVEEAKKSFIEIYDLTLLPTYKAILPYAQTGYAHGHYTVSHIIFPFVRSTKDATLTFISRTLWPYVRILYADNVEPQLVRIRERLGRYRDGKKLEAFVSTMESSSVSATTSLSSATIPPTASTTGDSADVLDFLSEIWADETQTAESQSTSETAVASQPPPKPKESLSKSELKEKLKNDIRHWQSKFATAADKGAEDLEERVAEITKRQVENGVHGHGAALLVQLQETAKSTVEKFKSFIKQTVEGVPEDATQEEVESAYEKCIAQSRALGLTVKEKAQAIRTWKTTYDQETDYLVKSAVDNTLDVLQRIHDLGLQEVGLRWAWMDGVTYKDWQNYHKLRETFTEWQKEVEAIGGTHDGLRVAHDESKKLEDEAMAIAANMVHELLRLKEVSRWKIWAGDASDDFSNKKVPARAFKAAQSVSKNVENAASQVSESVVGSETTPQVERATSTVKEALNSVAKPAESAVKSKGAKLKDAIYGAKDEVVKDPSFPHESNASVAEKEDDSIPENRSAPHIKASGVPKKVFGGAMAAGVAEAKQVIFDDEIDDSDDIPYSEKIQSIIAGAGDYAADLTKAVSEAMLGRTSTQGSVDSVTSLASEQYEKALAAASSVLYGTKQAPIESMSSIASEKYSQAVTAASYAIYGTPTPTAIIQSIQIEANSQYDKAVSQAQEQYSKAKAQLSEAASGTPTPVYEQMASSVEKAYSDSLSSASAKLQAALQYTGSAKSYFAGPTQGALESVSSVAASKLSEGLSLASAQFRSQPTPVVGEARRRYYEAVGLAHARYAEFLDTASSLAYGPQQGTFESIASILSASAGSLASEASSSIIGTETPWAESVASVVSESAKSLASEASSTVIGSETPWTQSVASEASQNWEALVSKASVQIYGAPTPFAESVYSQAASYGAQATAQAAEQFGAVQALISELVVGKEPDFTESVMNRLSSAYYTGYPAVVASAGSYASENYEAAASHAADAYASASSVVSSIFTPPATVEAILNDAADQVNSAVEAVSIQIYGTPKGTIEAASESVASAYSSIQSKASVAIYGTPEAQAYFADVAASAQKAISEAIFPTPSSDGYVASVTNGAADAYSSASSVASEKAAQASSAVSSAIYGPEQGALESATSRLSAAIEIANSRISEMLQNAASSASEAASTVSSAASAATQSVKDEL